MSNSSTWERLTAQLESVIDQEERSTKGVTEYMWFRLAAVAVRCLISIASAMWDK